MKNKYLNPWSELTKRGYPEFYENDARCVGRHRGVSVFKINDHQFDYVFADVAITQLAGFSSDRLVEIVDSMLDGERPLCNASVKHLKAHGFDAITYDEACQTA